MVDFGQLTMLPHDARIKELFGYFQERRATQPVAPSEQADLWEIFSFDEAMEVLHRHDIYTSDKTSLIPGEFAQLASTARGNFIGLDPPRHTQLRTLVSKAFTPRVIERLKPRISVLADKTLDEAIERIGADGRIDLVQDFASPLSASVIAELFGVPETDHQMFWQWSDGLLGARPPGAFGAFGAADGEAMARLAALVGEAGGYLLEHIARSRAHPGDDLTSALTLAEIDGKHLDDDEIFGIIGMFLIAGHLSTSLFVGNTVMCLDEQPAVMSKVRAEPAQLGPVLEEVLRWRPPLLRDQRVAKQETTLGGQTIPAGASVCVWLASANRDERHFDHPEVFDPSRTDGQHRAFGHGIHYCLGAPLARLEAEIAVSALFARVEEIAIQDDGGLHFHPSIGLLGPIRLPAQLRLTAS